jgi:hypothetical protein
MENQGYFVTVIYILSPYPAILYRGFILYAVYFLQRQFSFQLSVFSYQLLYYARHVFVQRHCEGEA